MARATRTATVNAPIDRVWSVLADFAGTSRWNPLVPVSYAANGQRTGLGARRRCEFNDDGTKWLEEHIVAFDETSHRYTLQIIEGTEKPPVADVHVTIAARELTADTTEVTMTADLTAAGPIQKVIAGVGALALRRALHLLLAGLEHHIVTGNDVADPKQLRSA